MIWMLGDDAAGDAFTDQGWTFAPVTVHPWHGWLEDAKPVLPVVLAAAVGIGAVAILAGTLSIGKKKRRKRRRRKR